MVAVLVALGGIIIRYELALRSLDKKYAAEMKTITQRVAHIDEQQNIKVQNILLVNDKDKLVGSLSATGLFLYNPEDENEIIRITHDSISMTTGQKAVSYTHLTLPTKRIV